MGLMSSKYSQGPEMIRTSVHYKHYGGFLGDVLLFHSDDLFFFFFVAAFCLLRYNALRQSAFAHTHAHTQCNYVGLLHRGPRIDKKLGGLVYHVCFIVQTFDLG